MKHVPSSLAVGVLALALALAVPAPAAPADAPQQQPQQQQPQAAPFRILFAAYNDQSKKKPEDVEFQVYTLDLRQPTSFIKLGEPVPKTKLKLLKFERKLLNPGSAEEKDVSELTVIHTDTQETTTLVMGKICNLPSARNDR